MMAECSPVEDAFSAKPELAPVHCGPGTVEASDAFTDPTTAPAPHYVPGSATPSGTTVSTSDEQKNREAFAQGLFHLFRPAIDQVDSRVKAVRQSQVELRLNIDNLAEDLRKISDCRLVPIDLDPYIKKLVNTRRRVNNVNNLLQTVQDRINKVNYYVTREKSRRKPLIKSSTNELVAAAAAVATENATPGSDVERDASTAGVDVATDAAAAAAVDGNVAMDVAATDSDVATDVAATDSDVATDAAAADSDVATDAAAADSDVAMDVAATDRDVATDAAAAANVIDDAVVCSSVDTEDTISSNGASVTSETTTLSDAVSSDDKNEGKPET